MTNEGGEDSRKEGESRKGGKDIRRKREEERDDTLSKSLINNSKSNTQF